jgi:hypothetical protein
MDFITGLPENGSMDAILVVVDRFSKMAHFILTTSEISSQETAELLLHHVWKLHGTPRKILSDRGPQFVSSVWKNLCQRLGIGRKLSTAHHPQTNGQTERMNAQQEQYLRAYVNHTQENRSRHLPTAEFSYNNACSSAARQSLFFVVYRHHLRIDVKPRGPDSAKEPSANDLQKMPDAAYKSLLRAQLVIEEHSNKHQTPQLAFNPGDSTYLSSQHLSTDRSCKELREKFLVPFKILEQVGTKAYKLDLPLSMKVHPVFPVELMKPAPQDPLPSQPQFHIPPPIVIQGQEEYEVEEILNSRHTSSGALEYKVHWVGYPTPTWEAAEDVQRSKRLLAQYHARNPGRPREPRAESTRQPWQKS